jgi:hypothetical protein
MRTPIIATGFLLLGLLLAHECFAAGKMPPQCPSGSHSVHFENSYRDSDVYECELDKQKPGDMKMCREWEGSGWSPTESVPCGSRVSSFEVTRLDCPLNNQVRIWHRETKSTDKKPACLPSGWEITHIPDGGTCPSGYVPAVPVDSDGDACIGRPVTRLSAASTEHAITGGLGRTADANVTIDGVTTGQDFDTVNALVVQHQYQPLSISNDWLQSRCTSGHTSLGRGVEGPPSRICTTYRGTAGRSVAEFRNPDPSFAVLQLTFVQDTEGKYILIQIQYAPPKSYGFKECYDKLQKVLGTATRLTSGAGNANNSAEWEVGQTIRYGGLPTPRFHILLEKEPAPEVKVLDMELNAELIHAGQSR